MERADGKQLDTDDESYEEESWSGLKKEETFKILKKLSKLTK